MCGIAAWLGSLPYRNIYELLIEQQHRGHDAAGIALASRHGLQRFGGAGYVWQALLSSMELGSSWGPGIGHVRYSTSGGYGELYQPVISRRGLIALAFNGNIFNYVEAAREVIDAGAEYTWDAAALVDIVEHYYLETKSLIDAVREAARVVKGAYSIAALSRRGELVVARDPHGVRPLAVSIGDDVFAAASETAALSAKGLKWSELGPAHAVFCQEGPSSCYTDTIASPSTPLPCAFEYIYFLRPDSVFEGVVVHEARKRMGALLARIDQARADVVIPVPDSGRSAAIGYALEKGIPLDEALYRNRFVGRTFIAPPRARRDRLARKFSWIPRTLWGRRVVVVDDSIVRGHTARLVTRLLRAAGAAEVHFRSASPPIRYPCFFGIDIPCRCELVASKFSLEEIRSMIGADTLLYNTVENLVKAIGRPICTGCFTSKYPYKINMPLLEKSFTKGRR